MNQNSDKGKMKYMDLNDININNINKLREMDSKEEKRVRDLKREDNNQNNYKDEKNDFNIGSIREVLNSQNYNSYNNNNNNFNHGNTDKEREISKFELMRKLEAKLNCPNISNNTKEIEQTFRPTKNIKDFQSPTIISSNNNPLTLEFDTRNSNNLSRRIEKLK